MANNTTGGPLSDTQRNTVAMMAVQGLPTSAIASAIRRSQATVRRLIKNDEAVHASMAEYENRMIQVYAVHKFEMMGRLERCREIIDEGLYAPDLKLRLHTAMWTMNDTIPKQAEQLDITMNVEGQVELSQSIPVIAESIKELREAGVGVESFKKHLRDSLPGPTTLEDIPVIVEE
ncbi:MAG: helix-turn-helix domain-containing protein [Deltaproteobacteria bacterium]|nr:helix-turn-helix domain-containing protein [Deltaproteobacteria bacterium]